MLCMQGVKTTQFESCKKFHEYNKGEINFCVDSVHSDTEKAIQHSISLNIQGAYWTWHLLEDLGYRSQNRSGDKKTILCVPLGRAEENAALWVISYRFTIFLPLTEVLVWSFDWDELTFILVCILAYVLAQLTLTLFWPLIITPPHSSFFQWLSS